MRYKCVITTFQCNWNCNYCAARYKRYQNCKMKSDDEIVEIVSEKINNHEGRISLTGGEPGLMSSYFYDSLFKKLNKKVNVNTNGMWFKRGYYEKYSFYVDSIIYHCVKELTNNIEHWKYCYHDDVYPVVVIHSKNIKYIKGFLQRYPNFKIGLRLSINLAKNEYDLSLENLKQLVEELKGLNNYNIDWYSLTQMMSRKELFYQESIMLNDEEDLIDYELGN